MRIFEANRNVLTDLRCTQRSPRRFHRRRL
jgi:hypothetical protein